MRTTFLFHINTNYAEIPYSQLPIVVKKSYIPVLKLLHKHEGKFLLNITGTSIEYFKQNAPEVINIITELVNVDKIAITGCTYSHPILPLLPTNEIHMQIKIHKELVINTFEINPVGFFPPELAVDPVLPDIVDKYGYKWMMVDGETAISSEKNLNIASPQNPEHIRLAKILFDVDRQKGIHKIFGTIKAFAKLRSQEKNLISPALYKMKGVNSDFPILPNWTALTVGTQLALSGRIPWITINRQLSIWERYLDSDLWKKSGILMPYGTDIEFIGYRDFGQNMHIPPDRLSELLKLADNRGFTSSIPKLNDWANTKSVYVKSSSWSDNQNWELWQSDPDNIRLESLCNEIRTKLKIAPKEIISMVEHHLLLAENSDCRGWNPIPERKLYCFKHAIEALNILNRGSLNY